METNYQTLNLNPGATLADVKSSFRRLAKKFHPDVAAHGGDSIRFSEINQAYQSLLGELSRNQENGRPPRQEAKATPAGKTSAPPSWRFEGVTEKGADVVYVLRVTMEAALKGLEVVLPWQAEDACPKCLGQGQTLTSIFGGPHQRKSACLKCQATGVVKHNSTVRLNLTPEIIRGRRLRLKGLGHYQPRSAHRGDLIVEIITSPEYSASKLWTA